MAFLSEIFGYILNFLYELINNYGIAIIIFSIWESGYGVRYSADFAVELILGGMMIIYLLALTHKESEQGVVMRFVRRFFVISLAVAFIANFALIYDYLNKSGNLAANYLNFERIFEFWR